MDKDIKYLKYDDAIGGELSNSFPNISGHGEGSYAKSKSYVFSELGPRLFAIPQAIEVENDISPWMELFSDQGIYDIGCQCEELLSVIRIDKQYQMYVLLCLPVVVGNRLFAPSSSCNENKRVLFMLFNFEHDANRTLQLIRDLSETQYGGQTKVSQCLYSIKKYLSCVSTCGLVNSRDDIGCLLTDLVGPFQQDEVLGLDRGAMNDHLLLLSGRQEGTENEFAVHEQVGGKSVSSLFEDLFKNPHSKRLFATTQGMTIPQSILRPSQPPPGTSNLLLLTDIEAPTSLACSGLTQDILVPPVPPLSISETIPPGPPIPLVPTPPAHTLLNKVWDHSSATESKPSIHASVADSVELTHQPAVVAISLPAVINTHPQWLHHVEEDEYNTSTTATTTVDATSITPQGNTMSLKRSEISNSTSPVSNPPSQSNTQPISKRKLQILSDVISVRNAELAVMDALQALGALSRLEVTRFKALAPHGRKLLAHAIQDTDLILRSGGGTVDRLSNQDNNSREVAVGNSHSVITTGDGVSYDPSGSVVQLKHTDRLKRERMVSVLHQAWNGDFYMPPEQQRAIRGFLQQYNDILDDRERVREKLQGPDKLAWTLLLFGKGMLAMSELADRRNTYTVLAPINSIDESKNKSDESSSTNTSK